MNSKLIILISLLLVIASLSLATQPDPTVSDQTKPKPTKNNNHYGVPGGPFSAPEGSFFPPGFNIPEVGSGWSGGYGSGYGGPNGGHSKNGIVRPSVECKDKGPCYKTKLTCPAKCFSSYSHSGTNYGSGGGGGGCTMDCEKCVAYC